jgi:deltex-like protein
MVPWKQMKKGWLAHLPKPSSIAAPTLVDETILYIAPSSLSSTSATGVQRGSCPSGTMKIEMKHSTDFIQIVYEIPNGIQAAFHYNPGDPYKGTTRVAYLPNDDQGRHLLIRLKSAWTSGLIFTVGTSLSTGMRNVVTWSTIQHKTSLQSDPFGYPDPAYVPKCNASLDALQVPDPKMHTVQKERISYLAPPSMVSSWTMAGALRQPPTANVDGDCAICLDSLAHHHHQHNGGALEMIQGCKHIFHGSCIQRCLTLEPKCPMCRQPVGEPQGQSPSGTMSIALPPARPDRPGYKVKFITITYEIPSGTQLLYHENPGTCYTGTTRVAYLPDSPEGRQLLTRLKYAWTHGLIFRVGTSLTTGAHNVVTWASIHHKTSLSKSAHGFPDPNYFDNCNGTLDALFVPDADTCWYQQS